jgi:hypothetical protein
MTTELEDSPPPTGEVVTLDKLTRVYIKMREKLAELTRTFEAAEEAIKLQQAEVAAAMKDRLQALGAKSAATSYGTVSLKTSTRYYFQDWEAAHRFILEQEAPYLLEKRVSQAMMKEFLENNPGMVPPGLNTMSELTVSVTKPRK